MYKIAITNRKLTEDLLRQIEILQRSEYRYIILREKDMSQQEYTALARKTLDISDKIILHTFIETALELDYRKIHLPFDLFKENIDSIGGFEIKGVSTHSLEEAVYCMENKADYITYSHIFATDCKKGIEPKGLKALENVCKNVTIPVYALGGINEENAQSCIDVGARGVCMMSEAMKRVL